MAGVGSIAVRRQRVGHAVAVIDVHLAPIGLDEEAFLGVGHGGGEYTGWAPRSIGRGPLTACGEGDLAKVWGRENDHAPERQFERRYNRPPRGARPRAAGQPVAPAPVLSTTFLPTPMRWLSAEDLKADALHFCTRWATRASPSWRRGWPSWRQAEAALSFGRGMAAITAFFHDRLQAGDHLVLLGGLVTRASRYRRAPRAAAPGDRADYGR